MIPPRTCSVTAKKRTGYIGIDNTSINLRKTDLCKDTKDDDRRSEDDDDEVESKVVDDGDDGRVRQDLL